MTKTSFRDLGIIEQLARNLAKSNYTDPTPIQLKAIPPLLQGRDLLGIAQTGTGKTAAFALPILQKLFQSQMAPQPRTTRALIIAPTRELAIQIADSFKVYGEGLSLRQTTVFGGVSSVPQIKTMARGVDILIATPGRLLDLMNQRHINLARVSFLVLDEADRMLDMGFIKDIRKIIAQVPKQRQTLLFSATMPPSISGLAHSVLSNPQRVEATPEVITVELIKQVVYKVRKSDKRALLVTLLQDAAMDKTIVFSRTKHGANRIVKELHHARIPSAVIHGNKSQGARQRAMEEFRSGKIRVLVATDIAARGIDIDNISHVINYDLPNEPESYVHRIGRTARAGASGDAMAFCDETEGAFLRDIERLIRRKITVAPTPVLLRMAAMPATDANRDHGAHKSNRPQAPWNKDNRNKGKRWGNREGGHSFKPKSASAHRGKRGG
jgi:ATP-dependent RNA helicase RhlE